jgi:integration host factor subunit alpha
MTKADIVERVYEKADFNKTESLQVVDIFFELMKGTLAGGEDLKISGFGNFIVKHKADRRGRNPVTGEALTIEARSVLTFKPSPVLKQAMIQESECL